jgi:hypothetical protein
MHFVLPAISMRLSRKVYVKCARLPGQMMIVIIVS